MAKMTASEWVRTAILIARFAGGGLWAYKDLEFQVGVNVQDIAHNTQTIEEECTRSQAVDAIQDGRERQMAIDVTGITRDISYMSKKLEELVTELRKQ